MKNVYSFLHYIIFEWVKTHFEYEKITLSEFIECYNEPLFYSYSLSGSNVEANDKYGRTTILIASTFGNLEVVKYLYETYHADVEKKNNYEFTPINIASSNGHLEVVKYLYETCHAKTTKETIEKAGTEEIKKYLRSQQ